ncbi:hypothetical protein P9J64_00755 [Deltaproteobacteria bacterium IMCC39524]|nr:hypothetical protein [Deltaproteobacteria bacterium IMCC39524]
MHAEKSVVPNDLLLFGDSRIAKWQVGFFNSIGKVVNVGINGDVTPSMLWRLENDVLKMKPKRVVISAGINDIIAGSMMDNEESRQRNVRHVIASLSEIVKQLKTSRVQVSFR